MYLGPLLKLIRKLICIRLVHTIPYLLLLRCHKVSQIWSSVWAFRMLTAKRLGWISPLMASAPSLAETGVVAWVSGPLKLVIKSILRRHPIIWWWEGRTDRQTEEADDGRRMNETEGPISVKSQRMDWVTSMGTERLMSTNFLVSTLPYTSWSWILAAFH